MISSVPAAVRRRFAGNAAHIAVRDALQAVRGPAELPRNSPAQARIQMTRGWAVGSGGSTLHPVSGRREGMQFAQR